MTKYSGKNIGYVGNFPYKTLTGKCKKFKTGPIVFGDFSEYTSFALKIDGVEHQVTLADLRGFLRAAEECAKIYMRKQKGKP
jgi:hypothetical protein